MITIDQQRISNRISPEMGKAFQSLIRDRCCLNFKDNELDKLYSSIQERMTVLGLETPRGYLELLTGRQNHSEEWRVLLESLTIQHTFFFRNQPQFMALKHKVLPEIITQKTQHTPDKLDLTIWSAGCSTGQEPYSIAITVADSLENPDSWHIRIIATDISQQALETARQGIYAVKSVKDIDESILSRYFHVLDTDDKHCRFQINDQIKAWVDFKYLNLADAFFPQKVDIIFCRNVIIYFDTPWISPLIDKFEHSLVDEGYLFVGHSEMLPQGTSRFKMSSFEEGIYYQKTNPDVVAPSGVNAKDQSTESCPQSKPSEQLILQGKPETRPHVLQNSPADSLETLLLNIEDAIKLNEYALAKELIEQVKSKEADHCEAGYWQAQLLVNQGKMACAKHILGDIIAQHPFFVPAHYLLGLVLLHEQEDEKALAYFKKALYIDRHFVPARFALATTLKNNQQHRQARKEYLNTLNDVSKELMDTDIKYGNGLSYNMLVDICKKYAEEDEEIS